MDDRTHHFDSPLLTEREAAAYLRMCERKLWGMRKRGEIACVSMGRRFLYHLADLAEWVRKHTIPATNGGR